MEFEYNLVNYKGAALAHARTHTHKYFSLDQNIGQDQMYADSQVACPRKVSLYIYVGLRR